MVKVSVIIPVYNAQRYLREMLESICVQTLTQIEIICVDDGSADSSLQILKSYACRDSRILVLEQDHAGAGAARNLGMKIAKGKYLSILDADDFFEPDMLEKAYKACEQVHADVCVFRSDCFHTGTSRYEDMPWTIVRKLLPKQNPFTPRDIRNCAFQVFNGWAWDKLYRREAVIESGLQFQSIRTSNDAFFVFLMNLQANQITVIGEKLAHHRVDVETSLSVTREKSWQCCWQAIRAIRKELERRGQYGLVEQSFINWALHFLLWNAHSLKSRKIRKKLYGKMQEEYFPALRLEMYPKSFFYDPLAYAEYRNICQPDGRKKAAGRVYVRIRQKLRAAAVSANQKRQPDRKGAGRCFKV